MPASALTISGVAAAVGVVPKLPLDPDGYRATRTLSQFQTGITSRLDMASDSQSGPVGGQSISQLVEATGPSAAHGDLAE